MNKEFSTKTRTIVILGPTSSGKSDAAIMLAKKFDGEVISADSRQVYRDMNLGTGKVEGKWIRKNNKKVFISEEVIHHLLDFRSPRGEYNVSHFQKDCNRHINQISARNKLPIICGGTGFWIDAVVSGVILPQVRPDHTLRKKLNKKTTKQLHAQLKKLDSIRAKTIDSDNKQRLVRAIEICKSIGSVPKIDRQSKSIDQKFLQVGIDWPQEKLDQKIKKRLESRWTAGMIKEVQALREKYHLSWKKIQSFGLGYFWIPEFLRGKIDQDEMKERVFRAERGYAKRQRTWFKRDKTIAWENDHKRINLLVEKFLK